MTFRSVKVVAVLSLLAAAIFVSPRSALAQEVTYYDFDSLGSGNYSYTCAPITNPSSIFFCFNNTNSTSSYPILYPDTYPGSVDPNPLDDQSSTHTTLQISDGQTEYSSAWFAVPQKVLNGFTAYVAFRLAPPMDVNVTPGDGIAFVIQNASGGGTDYNGDANGNCVAHGSGLNISATIGGCIGYGGIDNSLAIEFDTYQNLSATSTMFPDGDNFDDPNANHIAIKSCGITNGVGLPNSPNHSRCQVGPIASSLPTTMSDGNVHQAVIEYTGETGTPANQWQVFFDPVFIAGTHTPDTTHSTPVITTTADLSHYMNLQNSGSANDSAFVGFTGASGGAYENQEILAWTYTPHTPVTQQQQLTDDGTTPTTFPYGAHTYAVTYPSGAVPTPIDMIVTANTVTPTFFAGLVGATSFAGSQCQIYEGTGGNCIIYSTYCVTHGTSNKVACPTTDTPLIAVKSAYESDNTPLSPAFLQGDPLYSQISTISLSGNTATVTCAGECAVTDGETVSIRNVQPADFNVEHVTVSGSTGSVDMFSFTYPAGFTPADSYVSGGFVTSNNVQNICDIPPFTTPPDNSNLPCWQAAKIDGTSAGKTKNFSDLVVLSLSSATTMTTISAPAINYGDPAQITVTVSPSGPADSVSLAVDGGTPITQTLSGGSTTFSVSGLAGGPHSLSATYAAQEIYGLSSATATLTVNPIAPTVMFTGAPSTAPYLSTFGVTAITNASVLPSISGTAGVCSVGTVSGSPGSASATVTMNSGTGTCSLTASWGADANYAIASLPQSTTASRLTPVITWTPAPIQLGYPLGAAQLNATADATGGFAYNPPSGTVVNTTSQSVTAQFTPAVPNNYNSASATVSLTVTPGPIAYVSPTSIDFGTVYLGSITTKTVTLTNAGNAAINVTGPLLSLVKGGNSKEFVEVNLCPKSLAVGKSCNMTIAFVAGPFYTPQTATLTIMDNAPGNPQTVALMATVINPKAKLSVSALSFGTVKVGQNSTKTVTLTSTGDTPLLINSITITGSGDFTLNPLNPCPASMAKNTTCTIGVMFAPSAKQSRSGTLKISDNASSSPQTVSLSGKGN